MKFAYANADTRKSATHVLFGVPDEEGSPHSGAKEGPMAIRQVSLAREGGKRAGQQFVMNPQSGPLRFSLFDEGDIEKKHVVPLVEKILHEKQVPVMLGGDHSLTYLALQGFKPFYKKKKLSVAYFDAHPDIICSSRNYYGSVVCDFEAMQFIPGNQSVLVGVRAPEDEEWENLKKLKLHTFPPLSMVEEGPKKFLSRILKRMGKDVYLSIDLDVLEPGISPGVSTPVPGGFTPNELFYLATGIAKKKKLVGLDVTEMNPAHDVEHVTAHIAGRLVAETLNADAGKKRR